VPSRLIKAAALVTQTARGKWRRSPKARMNERMVLSTPARRSV
jgi:hypothetical protein